MSESTSRPAGQSRQQAQDLNRELTAANQALSAARAEADLQRRQLHSILMQAPALVCILEGPDHVFKLVNPPYQRLVGDRPLLGRPIAEAMPELAGQPIFGLLDRVYRTGESIHAHEMLVQLDHDNSGGGLGQNYYNFTYQATRKPAGEVDGILVFAYEVTAQVQARQQVQVINEKLTAANEELQAINEELQVTNDELQRTQKALQQLNEELEARVAERTRELQQARQEAEWQRERLQAIFMQAPVAIGILGGREHTIEFVNPPMSEILAKPIADLLGKTIFEALPEVVGQGFEDILSGVFTSGRPFEAKEIPATLKKDDQLVYGFYNTVYQPLRDTEQEVTGIIQIVTDVTEQVEARRVVEQSQQQAQALSEELAAANEGLTRTNVDLDNFIYAASHDLKAPILNIEGLMDALLNQLPPESLQSGQVRRTTDLILLSVQRFKRTIEHLTDITKLQKENNQEASHVSLAAVLTDVQLDLAPAIEAAQAQVEVDVAACPTVRFSEKNLRSILYNLLSNAVKYRSPERAPLVRVRCRETAEHQVLSVQDNGLGIDLSQEHKLFAMFKGLHDHVEGSGIGLYIVKKIIENAGGSIKVQSRVGEGTDFSVYFRRNP